MPKLYLFMLMVFMKCVVTTFGTPQLSGRMLRVANGCGAAGSVNIDWALQLVGERVIIQCCNKHDVCYETCGQTQARCDNEFQSCLNSVCGTLGGWFQWWAATRQALCQFDGRTLFTIVNAFGSSAFIAAQQAHGCRG
ncbi:unnamed protein product [Rotaria sp. Silwood1]|nr:unnamed protein product [Rotaria sp. Silwood1]